MKGYGGSSDRGSLRAEMGTWEDGEGGTFVVRETEEGGIEAFDVSDGGARPVPPGSVMLDPRARRVSGSTELPGESEGS